jgi:hypothetical protein
VWVGQTWSAAPVQLDLIDRRQEDNNFYCVALLNTKTGDRKRRSKDRFERLCVLLTDDVDPKEILGAYSYSIETSPGNFQVGILLDEEDRDTSDKMLCERLLQEMVAQNIVKADASGNNLVRYGRLPEGTNTKERESGPFQTVVHKADLRTVYTLEDAAASFGVDLDLVKRALSNRSPLEKHEVPFQSIAGERADPALLFKALLAPDPHERSYHEPLLKLSSGMIASGMRPDAVRKVLLGLMEAVRPDSGEELWRWQARVGPELDRMIRGADKFAPRPEPSINPQSILRTAQEVFDDTENARWLVKGLVPASAIGLVFGASGTYKSFLCIDLAMHVALGLSWTGRKTVCGPVVYVAAEGGAGVARRIVAWCRDAGEEVPDNVHLCTVPLTLSAADDIESLYLAISNLPQTPALIIIDTLSQTFRGEENSSSDMAEYFRQINGSLRAVFDATVAVVHHSGHSATERPRGSSAIVANTDFILGVFKPDDSEKVAKLTVLKQKDADRAEDMFFSLGYYEFGLDSDGDMVSSLVAKHDDAVMLARDNLKRARPSKYEALVLKALAGGKLATETEMRDSGSYLGNTGTVRKGVWSALQALEDAKTIRRMSPGVWCLSA